MTDVGSWQRVRLAEFDPLLTVTWLRKLTVTSVNFQGPMPALATSGVQSREPDS